MIEQPDNADSIETEEEVNEEFGEQFSNELEGITEESEVETIEPKESIETEQEQVSYLDDKEFKPIKYKANGEEHVAKDLKEVQQALSAYPKFTQAMQEKARVEKEFAEIKKPYELLEREIQEDPDLAETLGLMVNSKKARAIVSKALQYANKNNLINQSEVESTVYKRQLDEINQQQEVVQKEQRQEQLMSTIHQQWQEIEKQHGGEVDEELEAELIEIAKAKRVQLPQAYEWVKQREAKLQQKVRKELQAKQNKIRRASAPRGRIQVQNTEDDLTDADFGDQFAKALLE